MLRERQRLCCLASCPSGLPWFAANDARVAKLVNAVPSQVTGLTPLWVRVPPRATSSTLDSAIPVVEVSNTCEGTTSRGAKLPGFFISPRRGRGALYSGSFSLEATSPSAQLRNLLRLVPCY